MKPVPTYNLALLGVGFGLGLVGFGWDALEHLGRAPTDSWPGLGHILMTVGELLTLAVLTMGLRRRIGRLAAYGLFLGGLLLALVWHPLAGSVLFSVLAALGVGIYGARGEQFRPMAVASAGLLCLMIGGIVDTLWHTWNATTIETNILVLPGHQIMLLGWLTGCAALVVAYRRALSQDHVASRGDDLLHAPKSSIP
jgi:hypothetical protein